MSILDYELVEYRIYYSLGRCFKRVFTEEEAIKAYNELSKIHDDVKIRKIQKAVIPF